MSGAVKILGRLCVGALLSAGLAMAASEQDAFAAVAAKVVKRAEINPAVPVFVPVHPRIATTVSFPKPIGEPMGTGFVESEAYQKAIAEGKGVSRRGEYAITFLQGDSFFTVQPLQKGELLNLNVPYEGVTVVLFFYAVDQPLDAVASLMFVEHLARTASAGSARLSNELASPSSNFAENQPEARIERTNTLPPLPFIVPSPARLEGFLRKLRLIHAAKPGVELDDVARALKVTVEISSVEDADASVITHPVSQARDYDLILLRAARDSALDAVGFVILMRNKSPRELVFDLRTLSVRCGSALYTARVIDAPAKLSPGEIRAGYFAIVGSADERPGYLSAANDWRLSIALVGEADEPADAGLADDEEDAT